MYWKLKILVYKILRKIRIVSEKYLIDPQVSLKKKKKNPLFLQDFHIYSAGVDIL